MSSTTVNPAWLGGRWRDRRATLIVARFVLAALAVGVCYSFEWHWLRQLTMELNLRLDALLGVTLQRVSETTVMWQGGFYHYVIACTFADAWCASIPLTWNQRATLRSNLLFLAGFTLVLFAVNIVRLSLSDVLVARGLSWNMGHNVVSGISYFLLWKFVWWRLMEFVRPAAAESEAQTV
ncbi:MAG TPA: hypothetical protein VN577_19045 [Terriglobales bacterium]|nr:hypothetical protein [Terriglobales bacterium]